MRVDSCEFAGAIPPTPNLSKARCLEPRRRHVQCPTTQQENADAVENFTEIVNNQKKGREIRPKINPNVALLLKLKPTRSRFWLVALGITDVRCGPLLQSEACMFLNTIKLQFTKLS